MFFDLETDEQSKILDIGAWNENSHFRGTSLEEFQAFSQKASFVCGHNIIHHDLPVLAKQHFCKDFLKKPAIDTLYLSALLFPRNPYHKLVKDYKLDGGEANNPVSDSRLAQRLLEDTFKQYRELPPLFKWVYRHFLGSLEGYRGFFQWLETTEAEEGKNIPAETELLQRDLKLIKNSNAQVSLPQNGTGPIKPVRDGLRSMKEYFDGKMCSGADLPGLLREYPFAAVFALTLIDFDGEDSIPPPWLMHHHPEILVVFNRLRYNRCEANDCTYCRTRLEPGAALKNIYGFEAFRRFEDDGEVPLQEQVVRAALDGKSLLAVFPTGGGKSITFQLPALMKAEACRSLTVVISPLQSLMKDQVDSLKVRHERSDAVTLNGMLSPLERAEAVARVESGAASLLYISPESLRSNTILRLLRNRTIERFVIDEAHCFSSWGQDFRVDYQYIGEFLVQLAREKNLPYPIPVSCFTATAKPSVMEDIQGYFKNKLGVELEVFQTAPARRNLSYGILHAATPEEKFRLLLELLERDEGPKIIYTTYVRSSMMLAEQLMEQGYNAASYNGRMPGDVKIAIQDAFMRGKIKIIVATSAFGMGIDKDDVTMVIHYNISGSLEDYMQEAGRAGRNKALKANCYALFDDQDLMSHFHLLNATRINKKEIFQVWQGIKKIRLKTFSRSALELARAAGWDTEMFNGEMRVKTALAALEDSGFIKRGRNQTRVYATSLLVGNMEEAVKIIDGYRKLDKDDRLHAVRIVKFIITYREAAVDTVADSLGISLADTRRLVCELKMMNILAGDDKDLTAYIPPPERAAADLEACAQLELELLEHIRGDENNPVKNVSLKDINSRFRENNIDSRIEALREILFTWDSQRLISKKRLDPRSHLYRLQFQRPFPEIKTAVVKRLELARGVLEKLMTDAASGTQVPGTKLVLVEFSMRRLKEHVENSGLFKTSYSTTEYERALLYLNEIRVLRLDRGLFVYYNPYTITRCKKDNRSRYTNAHYKKFESFYRHRIEQVHIVGEYARKLAVNYKQAMSFVQDYFSLDYKGFLKKHFPRRLGEIRRPITRTQFNELFKDLSPAQLGIIDDGHSRAILVAAGPGSGKTRVLVHKVASLLLLEDVRTEQFLMLTYSRAAAMEMRGRLRNLVKKKADYIDIFTFHSFAFNLAELKGDLQHSGDIVARAVELILSGEAAGKVENKSVLVLDEFQDIGPDEFRLIRAIAGAAKEIRVIAVGDDDQSIFEFRGSSVEFMNRFRQEFDAKVYHLNTNFRSKDNLVQFSNCFIKKLPGRVKEGQELVSFFQGENGGIDITNYISSPLLMPLTEDVLRQRSIAASGTTAVLTATNQEAYQVYTLLRQQGCKAKLMAAYGEFSLKTLVELMTFTYHLEEYSGRCGGRDIDKADWDNLKELMKKKFHGSTQLPLALSVVETFEASGDPLLAVNWREYLDEMRLEDFIFPDEESVLVSTMHKAKGKEFDRVFLLLDRYKIVKNENLRVIYVAVTRAGKHLHIHTNLDIFDDISVSYQHRYIDNRVYSAPERLSLQLTPRDVFLDFFTRPKVARRVKMLQAGDILTLSSRDWWKLTAGGDEVLSFSNSGRERLQEFFKRGYRLESAYAQYIVVWTKKEEEKPYRIILPRLELVKHRENQTG